MRCTFFLVFTRRGVVKLVKRGPPKLGSTQYATKLTVDVPDAVFTTSVPSVEIRVPPEAVAAQRPTVTVERILQLEKG